VLGDAGINDCDASLGKLIAQSLEVPVWVVDGCNQDVFVFWF
jgi:hypothetical protein